MIYNTYTYFIKNKITNQFYYGSRKANVRLQRTSTEDFWIYYFTSSKNIKDLISIYGKDSFEFKVLHESENYEECFWFEQQLISQEFNNPLCLNRHYIVSLSGQNRFSFKGCNHSEKSIEKIRQNHKGMSGKKHTEETKKKISENHKGMQGLSHSYDTIKKMSDIKMGNTYGKGNKGNTGRIQSEESNRKRSTALLGRTPWNKGLESHNKGKSKTKYICQHCQKVVGGLSTLNRWHNANCPQYNSKEEPH